MQRWKGWKTYKRAFQVRITGEDAARWEETVIKGGRWKQNRRIHQWEASVATSQDDLPAGPRQQNRADSSLMHVSLLTQLKIKEGRCIIKGLTVEMSHEQIMWKINESFLSQAGKYIYISVSDTLLPSSGEKNTISIYVTQPLKSPPKFSSFSRI